MRYKKIWSHGVIVGLGLRLRDGMQRKESERWCSRAAIRTAMPPAAAMATLLSTLFHARFTKTQQAFSRTAALSGCVFMTASVACRGEGGMEVSKLLLSLVGLGSE